MDFAPLCEPWPAVWCDGQLTPTVTGSPTPAESPLMAASEALWAASGHRYGACNALVRPCRQSCGPTASTSSWWWDRNSWPISVPGWLDVACGRCASGCGCSSVSELLLQAPAQAIVEVMVDGEVLPPSGYAFYDGYRLVKTEGDWPLCQDWTIPVSGVGAWHVIATYGLPVPVLGQRAVAEVAAEFDKACRGESCGLASAFTESITRAGVTRRFNLDRIAEGTMFGTPLADRFIAAVNPHGIRVPPRIWNPDDYSGGRRPGGVT